MPRNRILDGVHPESLVSARFTNAEAQVLRRLAGSTHASDRRLCLHYLRKADRALPAMRGLFLEVADLLIRGLQPGDRWELFVLLGEFIESNPDELWAIVERWGSSRSRDIRSADAVCILEHLLERRFGGTFPKVSQVLESGRRRFAFTRDTAQGRQKGWLVTILRWRFGSRRVGRFWP